MSEGRQSLREEYLSIDDRSDIPNQGSYARRIAHHLGGTEERGSWYRRAFLVAGDVTKYTVGSWRTRLLRAIKDGLEEIIYDPGEEYDEEDKSTWDPPDDPQTSPPASPPTVHPPTSETLPNGKQRKNIKIDRGVDHRADDVRLDEDNEQIHDIGHAEEISIDLNPGQSRRVEFRARNSQGTSDWSEPVDISAPEDEEDEENGDGPEVSGALGDLDDVDTSGQSDGDELEFDGALWKPVGDDEPIVGTARITEGGLSRTTEDGTTRILEGVAAIVTEGGDTLTTEGDPGGDRPGVTSNSGQDFASRTSQYAYEFTPTEDLTLVKLGAFVDDNLAIIGRVWRMSDATIVATADITTAAQTWSYAPINEADVTLLAGVTYRVTVDPNGQSWRRAAMGTVEYQDVVGFSGNYFYGNSGGTIPNTNDGNVYGLADIIYDVPASPGAVIITEG